MHTNKRTIYYCSHCERRHYHSSAPRRHHEGHCFKNPDRAPYFGELTSAEHLGSYDWDPDDSDDAAPWWPGETGLMFTWHGWVRVPGYAQEGRRGGSSYGEVWPEMDVGPERRLRLPEVEPLIRVGFVYADESETLKPGIEVVCAAATTCKECDK